MSRPIDLQELRVFLTLADELHFGQTAERLRLTPSRVSQRLRELEGKLGAQLVHRTSRQVRLTPFGERLLRDVRPALEELDGVLERTAAAAQRLDGTLRLGIVSGPAAGRRLVEIIRAFEKRHAECAVEVVQLSWDDPFDRLRDGDVELIASWVPLEQPDLIVGPVLGSEPRVLAVAADHPLARRESVDVEELADHQVSRFDNWPKELHEAMVPSRTPAGRAIPFTRVPAGERSVLDLSLRVARGEIVHPTVASAPAYLGEVEHVFVPLTGMEPLESALVWRRAARDPRVLAFSVVAREVLGG